MLELKERLNIPRDDPEATLLKYGNITDLPLDIVPFQHHPGAKIRVKINLLNRGEPVQATPKFSPEAYLDLLELGETDLHYTGLFPTPEKQIKNLDAIVGVPDLPRRERVARALERIRLDGIPHNKHVRAEPIMLGEGEDYYGKTFILHEGVLFVFEKEDDKVTFELTDSNVNEMNINGLYEIASTGVKDSFEGEDSEVYKLKTLRRFT
jgi:hypothetical protein